VSIITGAVGGGKTMYATRLLRQESKRRRQYCTYQTPYARPLLTIAHAWCEEFAHSDFTVDESGSSFSARDTKDLDLLAFGAISHARHQDVRVRFICQHPAMLDIQFRRLAEVYILVRRHGPGGEYAKNHPDAAFWRRPWWFTARHYRPMDFSPDNMELLPNAKPIHTERFGFDRTLANSYDSFNHVVPINLIEDFRTLRAGAAACAALPEYRFINGRPAPLIIPDESVWWPVAAVSAATKFKAAQENVARVARLEFLQSIGYFAPDAAPENALPDWTSRPRAAKFLEIEDRILAARVVPETPYAVELLVGVDQWVVIPKLALGEVDPDSLVGRKLSCTLAVYRDGSDQDMACVSLDHPVRVRG